jgi:agmatine deiminase
MTRHFPSEWATQSAIQFTFPHEDSDWQPMLDVVIPCFVGLIQAVSKHQKVVVICKNSVETAKILRGPSISNFGFRMSDEREGSVILTNENCFPIELIELESNDTWARDHGGITVFDNGKPVLLDFIFNGWGLKFAANHDNLLTQKLFDKGVFTIETIEKVGLVLEGGGVESDGEGTLMTTAECLLSPNRNPHLSKKDIEKRLKKLFGVRRILWLNNGYLAGDDTDSHIDTLARFCDTHTICYVQCLDKKDEHYKALKAMEKELKTFKKADGTPYNLVPLPMSDAIFDEDGERLPATYANFLIINGAVLVPTYGVKQDEKALEILRGCFPDREIVGLDCRPLIYQHGSLHCVTMQFPEGCVK